MGAWADAATLVASKHLDGGLVAQCAAGLSVAWRQGMPVALVPPVTDAPRRVTLSDFRALTDSEYLVHFAEVESMTLADKLVGCHCLVPSPCVQQQAGCGEGLFAQCAGWTVLDERFGCLGRCAGVEELPGHSLLRVRRQDGEEPELLIPLGADFICAIDEAACCLHTRIPQGLLEL